MDWETAPPVLRLWAKENGLLEHTWQEVRTPLDHDSSADTYEMNGITLAFIWEAEGIRYYAGCTSTDGHSLCYWLGLPQLFATSRAFLIRS